MPEPRVIIKDFDGFVGEKELLFELIRVVVVEPMGEMNENTIEWFSIIIFGCAGNDVNLSNESNAKTTKDSKDAFFANIGKDTRNANTGIVEINKLRGFFL